MIPARIIRASLDWLERVELAIPGGAGCFRATNRASWILQGRGARNDRFASALARGKEAVTSIGRATNNKYDGGEQGVLVCLGCTTPQITCPSDDLAQAK